jgi:hypothetical protein
MNTSLIEHHEKQSQILHQSRLKHLENYLFQYFYQQDTEEHQYEFLQDTFMLNVEVLELAFQLITNELKYLCSNREIPEALTLQDNLKRGCDTSTTKKYDVRNYTQLNKIMNMKEADMN